MKKISTSIITFLLIVTIAPNIYADDNSSSASSALKSLFQTLGSGSSSTTSSSTDESSTSNTSTLFGSLGSIGDAIQNLISSDDIEINTLVGTWAYSAPAVAFKSDNLLKKAGGAAAASSVEDKLEKYYKIAKIQSLKLEIKEDSTFTMSFSKVTLSGNITKDEEGNIFFNYNIAGKINIGSVQTYLTKSGDTLNVMYDVSKLVTLLQKVGSYVGSSTISSVTSLLGSYDGITAGFKLTKQEQ